MVQASGYDAELRLARVGDPLVAPRTHLGVFVTLDGVRHLADPGIGVPPLAPIPLVDGAVLPGGIWAHEIRQVEEGPGGPGWQLWRQRSSGWELMHTTDELPVRDLDELPDLLERLGTNLTADEATRPHRRLEALAGRCGPGASGGGGRRVLPGAVRRR